VRRSLTRHLSAALVLLCLQAMATVMPLRRDPVERLEGSAIAGLVWFSVEARRDRRTFS
jgi:hypothetical protein